MKSTPSKILAAAVLGTKAFNAGRLRVPALDKDLKPLLAGNQIGEGLPVLNAWLEAWDAANLAADYQAEADAQHHADEQERMGESLGTITADQAKVPELA